MGSTVVDGATTGDLTDSEIKIPSYQRKGGKWNAKKGEKKILFCISLLSDYPIGSVVLHTDSTSDEVFLMDGQQRRETVDEISKIRPFLFILDNFFTKNLQGWQDKLTELLLDEFFRTEINYDGDFDPITRPGIQRLVALRECYGMRATKDGHAIYPLEKKILHNRIVGHPYVWASKQFKGEEFAKKLVECHGDPQLDACDLDTDDGKTEYIERLLDLLGIYNFSGDNDNKQEKSKQVVVRKFATSAKEFSHAIDTLYRFNHKTTTAKIGRITFTASEEEEIEFDLPTIFRLINDQGVPLTRVELLASSPRWTGTAAHVTIDASVLEMINAIISELKPNNAVKTSKWHICAAFCPGS